MASFEIEEPETIGYYIVAIIAAIIAFGIPIYLLYRLIAWLIGMVTG